MAKYSRLRVDPRAQLVLEEIKRKPDEALKKGFREFPKASTALGRRGHAKISKTLRTKVVVN